MDIRVGVGYDIHPFAGGTAKPLVLGGVTISLTGGLAGHSDADALAHAVADAVLGAAGLPDIGTLFPASDPQYEGIDSLDLLGQAIALARRNGWRVGNVDSVLNAETPRLAEHLPAMAERLSTVVGAPVTVKAKRGEGIGTVGRREGIAAHAVALLFRDSVAVVPE